MLAAGAGALLLAVCAALRARPWLRFAAACVLCLLLGLAFASLRLASLERSRLVAQAGESGRARVVVTGPVKESASAVSAPGQIESFSRVALSEPVWIELPAGKKPPVGAMLELDAQVQLPRPKSASGFDQRAWLARQGIHVVLKAAYWRQVGRRGGIGGFGDRLRERLVRYLAPGLKGERRGLVLGLVLGEDEGLSPGLRQSFRRSGLYHLLAVSGQNIAFLVTGVLAFSWLLGIPRRLGEVLALATIGAYVLVVGWQPSVIRAAVAGALASLAWLAARPRDRWYFLLLGAAVLLGWNPRSLYDPGFQLSFAAVGAIFLGEKPLERFLEKRSRLPKWLRAVVAVSLVCTLATTPIMLLQFGKVPVYGVLANAFVEPVVPLILFLGLACALVAPVAFSAVRALAFLNGLLASYIGLCARFTGSLPGAQVGRAELLRLAPALFLIAVAPFLERPRLSRFVSLVLLAYIPLWGWQQQPRLLPPPPEGLRVTFMDVGEGDSTLLQTREGAVLIDAGPPEANVAGQLRRLGIGRIDVLLLSHPHRDHVGGAAEVLRKLDVELVLDSGIPSSDSDERAALGEARRRSVPLRLARAGQELELGDLRLHILSPTDESANAADDVNEAAIVVIASYGSVDLLLPADSESPFTLPLAIQPVEVYKVAHHGSADDGLRELLERLDPQIAIISVGRDNDYGHPTPSTLATLAEDAGLAVFRTDRDGRVTLESDGCSITVKAQHAQAVSLPCGGA
ncbi:MAG: DNA internalization-related competence protein ComEC/Rec2 [Gaiellaceae bacterium]